MRGRQQPNFMPELYQSPPPMMRRGARLHRHHAWRQRGEKRDELGAPELAGNNDLAIGVDRVDLKDPLRQIQTDPRDASKIPDRLAHGRLPFRWGFDNDHLGTLMPFGAVAVGTEITLRPPHRSRRALLTHRAPTLDRDEEPLLWPRMQDAREWQVPVRDRLHSGPR